MSTKKQTYEQVLEENETALSAQKNTIRSLGKSIVFEVISEFRDRETARNARNFIKEIYWPKKSTKGHTSITISKASAPEGSYLCCIILFGATSPTRLSDAEFAMIQAEKRYKGTETHWIVTSSKD